jgi:hypothetical protein
MPAESWHFTTEYAVWALFGVAACLAAVVRRHRSRSERVRESRWNTLVETVRGLERRVYELESPDPADRGWRTATKHPLPGAAVGRSLASGEPTLIAVPNLEASPGDRVENISGLKERHAAIWALAERGATPEVIARATGQPIGQIELVLGLRRQFDGSRTSISHAPHG